MFASYVPQGKDGGMETLLVGGDRLTEGASRGVQLSLEDGTSPQARLEGLHIKFEDWHAIKNLYEVSESNNATYG